MKVEYKVTEGNPTPPRQPQNGEVWRHRGSPTIYVISNGWVALNEVGVTRSNFSLSRTDFVGDGWTCLGRLTGVNLEIENP